MENTIGDQHLDYGGGRILRAEQKPYRSSSDLSPAPHLKLNSVLDLQRYDGSTERVTSGNECFQLCNKEGSGKCSSKVTMLNIHGLPRY